MITRHQRDKAVAPRQAPRQDGLPAGGNKRVGTRAGKAARAGTRAGKAAPAPAPALPVVAIAGPTASGKSALALTLAEAFDGVIINADSMQLYRELKILTARPGRADTAAVPHRLYGVIPAGEPCSAGRWRALALAEIAAAAVAGRLPILVGGTGLYLKAVMEGLAPVPKIPQAVRAAARALHARLGGEAFQAALRRRDPVMAGRLGPADSQRLIRAYEVVTATGRSLADWQEGGEGGEPAAGAGLPPGCAAPENVMPGHATPTYAMVLLDPPRKALYEACDRRFTAMVERGAVDEVRRLDALGLDPGLPAMKAVGVPELRRYLHGDVTLEAACDLARQATRRYAKRQVTWFRHQAPGAHRVPAQYSPAQHSTAHHSTAHHSAAQHSAAQHSAAQHAAAEHSAAQHAESLEAEIFSFIRRFLLTARG